MNYEKYKFLIVTGFDLETYNDIIDRWSEPHRFYHNLDHLNFLIKQFEILRDIEDITTEEMHRLIVAAFFHDVIYDPKLKNNEELSIHYFVNKCEECGTLKDEFIEQVGEIISDTQYRKIPTKRLSMRFWETDNSVLQLPVNKLIEVEHKIFQEYQWVDYRLYRKGRIEFLESSLGMFDGDYDDNIKELIEYVRNRVIRIGVYAGSFNPFHVGHLNILEKAKPMFDKIIVAFGKNPDKEDHENVFPTCLDYIHRMEYSGLVTDLIDSIEERGSIVTLLRGIRNGADLSYESNQVSFINDLRPNTNVIYIPADKKYEHVSSSAIRNLMKFDVDAAKKYMA